MEYIITYKIGQIVLSQPTGRIITDPDGWSWEEHTDSYTLLPDGTKTDFKKHVPYVRWMMDEPKKKRTLREKLTELFKWN